MKVIMIKGYILRLLRHQFFDMSKLTLVMILIAAGAMQVSARIITVADVPQLKAAVNNLQAGDTIEVANGIYDIY
jgi:hypothetical protein